MGRGQGRRRLATVDDRLRSVAISGFTSIGHASLELRDLNVLIGANGAGKSNFIRALELLGQIVDGRLRRYVAQAGGASALLNQTLNTNEIELTVQASSSRYRARLALSADEGLFFDVESIGHRSSGEDDWTDVILGFGHQETRLVEPPSGPSAELTVISQLLDLLRGCRVYHFHDTSRTAPVKRSGPTADNIMLRADAGNLAAVLAGLGSGTSEDLAAYRRIASVVNQVAPFFDDFVLAPHGGDNIRFRWREKRSEKIFSVDQMSDGTLRFVCLATLLLSPRLPHLVVLDEPELGLHPSAIVQLADLLEAAATRSQILVATQSVTLLNQFGPDDLVVVERSSEGTILRRPDTETLETWLDEYALGELWEKNIIGGRPGRAGRSLA